ncbi:unnamed protein product [Durusdinium trenchii]|uniref:SURF1-like protein n=1 Tax=Durusdinium trenchii TaxID=1381693 RepID=A0ABP0HN01_9DINO
MHVGPRPGSDDMGETVPGVLVVTPLRLEDGSTVLVNRGHLPTYRLERATRPEVPTWVRVRGVLEEGEIPNFAGKYARLRNRPDKNQYLYLLADELAENANARNHEECAQALVTAIDVLYEDVRHAIGCVAGVIDGCPGALGTGVRGIDRPLGSAWLGLTAPGDRCSELGPLVQGMEDHQVHWKSSIFPGTVNTACQLLGDQRDRKGRGTNRDVSKKGKVNGEPEFKKDDYCKFFLVGYCPGKTLGREIESLRAEFDPKSVIAPCNKLHSIGVREEFKAHKDYEKYKRRYEDDLLHLIDKGIRECEDKVAREKRRHVEGIAVMIDQESGDTGETPGPIDGWHYMGTIEGSSESPDRLCEICGLKYKLRFADINVRETEGGKYKPDIHPECDL